MMSVNTFSHEIVAMHHDQRCTLTNNWLDERLYKEINIKIHSCIIWQHQFSDIYTSASVCHTDIMSLQPSHNILFQKAVQLYRYCCPIYSHPSTYVLLLRKLDWIEEILIASSKLLDPDQGKVSHGSVLWKLMGQVNWNKAHCFQWGIVINFRWIKPFINYFYNHPIEQNIKRMSSLDMPLSLSPPITS